MHTAVVAPRSHRTVVYCVVPADLAKLYHPLRSWFAHWPGVEVVLDRRSASPDPANVPAVDRRAAGGTAPARIPELPRIATAYADRLAWVQRPVAREPELARGDDRADAQRLAAGDERALEDLWLRHFTDVHRRVARATVRRSRQHALTTAAFTRAADAVRARPDVEVGQALRVAVDDLLADRRRSPFA